MSASFRYLIAKRVAIGSGRRASKARTTSFVRTLLISMANAISPFIPSSDDPINPNQFMYALLDGDSITSAPISNDLPNPKGFFIFSATVYGPINSTGRPYVHIPLVYIGGSPNYGSTTGSFFGVSLFTDNGINFTVKYNCRLRLSGRNITISSISHSEWATTPAVSLFAFIFV